MSGKVSSLSITDSGQYYTLNPTVIIDAPRFDSGSYAAIDSSFFKFGCGSLTHDSNDTSILGTVSDSIGSKAQHFTMQSFWFYLDSLKPCTLTWSENFRVFVGNNQKLNIAYTVDSSNRDAFQTDNVEVRDTASLFVQARKWHFAKIETYSNSLRIGLDSSFSGTYVSSFSVGDNYLYDSGDIIRAGIDGLLLDSGSSGPNFKENIGGQYVYDSNSVKSFAGNIDNFQLTFKSSKTTFVDFWSNWVPDSAGETYENQTPMLSHHFDYRRAKANALIDSSVGRVDRLVITDSGCGYDSAPGVTLIGGNIVRDSNYRLGDIVEQTFSSGVKIQGEVQWYTKDSALDSARYLSLAHVGADDGNYHTFIGDTQLINKTLNHNTGLEVISVEEQNKMSENEQNEVFSQDFVDDFLDFSENNPFGDPENN